jgi:probable DNA repair protein
MYEWLSDALQGPSTVITANRRLARVLQQEFARQQVQLERRAWESPAILAWQDWLSLIVQGASNQAELPARLNSHQSQLLWERSLLKELGESTAGISSLVRLSRDAWQRMADWQVSIREVARSAQNHDQRLFAAAAGRYLGILERESWVDEAGLGQLVNQLLKEKRASCSGRVTFVGFDRTRPLVSSIQESLEECGAIVRRAPARAQATRVELQCFETAEVEMRAAGAWARSRREVSPGESIAIIATNLEQRAQQVGHLVREGLVPGWQYAPASFAQAVNTSYGRKLGDYPAIAIALLLANWLVRDLSSAELGHLFRTPLLGSSSGGERSRLELRLRQLPDRRWTPAMVSSSFRGADGESKATKWFEMVAHLSTARRELQKQQRASPADWAIYIDEMLLGCGWPGSETLSSADFQLVNRWRDTLNDLARLEIISPSMSLRNAIRRLELMAADAVFQPESDSSAVQLMGPLEASGAEFGAIWISGVTAANWPPPGNPSPLLARQLQRSNRMPDAEPHDTMEYAQGLLQHLGCAAPMVVCSFAKHQDDAEQSPSGLLASINPQDVAAQVDPGWHASLLASTGATVVGQETVPTLREGESISGGASVIQRQLNDPVTAFIAGRLGASYLQTQARGLPAALRGNIIHDALHRLYIDLPSQRDIAAWSEEQLNSLISQAVDSAFVRPERNTDLSLAQLLRLERTRIARLLGEFVEVDRTRDQFEIAAVEQPVEFAEAGVKLKLRIDRVDRLSDGKLAILDYKTGTRRTLIDSSGQPKEIQLIAYTLAMDAPIAAIALVNVDSRAISFEGAGTGYAKSEDWEISLENWKDLVRSACDAITAGDVRINAAHGVDSWALIQT